MKSLLFLTMLFSLRAYAEEIKMLTVQSDFDTNRTAEMLIQTQNNQSITNILYHLGDEQKIFSIEDLNKSKKAIIKKGPVAILEISTESKSATDLILSIRYLYNFSFFGSDRRTKKLQMHYVAPSNTYETIDLDTEKAVRNAFAYVRYDNGQAKGIDRIETW